MSLKHLILLLVSIPFVGQADPQSESLQTKKTLQKRLSSRIQQLTKSGELDQWIKEEEKKLLEN